MTSDYGHFATHPLAAALGFISFALSPMPRFHRFLHPTHGRLEIRAGGTVSGDIYRFYRLGLHSSGLITQGEAAGMRSLIGYLLVAEGFADHTADTSLRASDIIGLSNFIPDEVSNHDRIRIASRIAGHLDAMLDAPEAPSS